MHLMYDECDI